MKVKNVKAFPEIFYGIHFSEGCAEYKEPDVTYRIFLNEDTIRKMDKSFAGKPVYVNHVDEVNLNNLQNEADGYVVESFKNHIDGKTWVKFIVISDRAKLCIKNGWKLSNSYIPKAYGQGGEWHGISYQKEIVDAEYEHLAIVDNPRYAESMILTPEQFKKYNEDKTKELQKIANSKVKGERKMKFNFFKKTKVDNSADLELMSVTLPKSKIEVTIEKLINDADDKAMVKDEEAMANMKHLVLVDNEKMSVEDLVAKHQAVKDELALLKKHDDEDLVKHQSDDEGEEKKENKEEIKPEEKPEEKKENEESDKKCQDDDKKKNEEEVPEKVEKAIEKKKNEKSHFEDLKNAPKIANKQIANTLLTNTDKVELGKKRYGSN